MFDVVLWTSLLVGSVMHDGPRWGSGVVVWVPLVIGVPVSYFSAALFCTW